MDRLALTSVFGTSREVTNSSSVPTTLAQVQQVLELLCFLFREHIRPLDLEGCMFLQWPGERDC